MCARMRSLIVDILRASVCACDRTTISVESREWCAFPRTRPGAAPGPPAHLHSSLACRLRRTKRSRTEPASPFALRTNMLRIQASASCRPVPRAGTARAPAVRHYGKLQSAQRPAQRLLTPKDAPRALHRPARALRTMSLAALKTAIPTALQRAYPGTTLTPAMIGRAKHLSSSGLYSAARRYLSTVPAEDLAEPTRSDKIIAVRFSLLRPRGGVGLTPLQTWLLILCAMVFVMVVLGGVTRLTESGARCMPHG